MKGSLRRRLTVCLVGMAVGSLLLAVAVTAALARSAAVDDAKTDLAAVAEEVPRLAGAESLVRLSARLTRVLDVDGVAVVTVDAAGRAVKFTGPPALQRRLDGKVDLASVAAGNPQTGTAGRTVFAARAVDGGGGGRFRRPVVVLTRDVAVFPVGRTGGPLLAAAGLVAVVAVAVALWLARRLTRPLDAVRAATSAIAGGDLSARVASTETDGELAAVARSVDAMAEDLERAKQAERAFLMSVSHDLRTPLTSIRGYAEALADGAAEGEEERRRAATVIAAEAVRLERLVADLLDLARLDAREFTLHRRPADVAATVERTVDGFRPAAAEVGVTLACHRPAEPLTLEVDPERLAQIVANLTENALKYAAARIDVTVSGSPAGGVVEVTDDGPGIDPAEGPRLFERLYSSRSTPGRKVGTGLGLAIVRELTVAMGGAVTAERAPGGGTRVRVTLPPAAPPSSSSRPASGSSSWSDSASSSSSWSSPPAGGS